ncbi:hypothetical protein THIAE_05785 [Thiomicrospira aerophila AL3]|uniref:Uncharacterized protein n=1 Tax=Thiomicrospira aerophila AL3 TaxID=717772 RepID=W0DZ54_9GAMM|nr:hypothetical protein [Thiomicrospira aerophila]AHF02259.1 hypothetical protein THIAE_05785 [Thiomicrospira aerophila AL3]
MFGWLFKSSQPQAPKGLPADLTATIDSATIVFRPGAEDGESRAIVTAPGLGAFVFDGINEAAARISKAWPELAPNQAKRAALLLASRVAQRNRGDFKREARPSWVFDGY